MVFQSTDLIFQRLHALLTYYFSIIKYLGSPSLCTNEEIEALGGRTICSRSRIDCGRAKVDPGCVRQVDSKQHVLVGDHSGRMSVN